jgi:hypothetical protein
MVAIALAMSSTLILARWAVTVGRRRLSSDYCTRNFNDVVPSVSQPFANGKFGLQRERARRRADEDFLLLTQSLARTCKTDADGRRCAEFSRSLEAVYHRQGPASADRRSPVLGVSLPAIATITAAARWRGASRQAVPKFLGRGIGWRPLDIHEVASQRVSNGSANVRFWG